MTESIQDFFRRNLPLSAVPFVPEILLHKAAPTSGLWKLADRDERFGTPYWAYYWGGGLALARFILDHPERVVGKRVLDLGCGSGIVAIAAARAGAHQVVAADVDPYAAAATALNARANGVVLETRLGDLTSGGPLDDIDLVTVGDLFYERETAEHVTGFLRRCAVGGADILIGDPSRAFLPHPQLEPIATYSLSDSSGAESPAGRRSTVFSLKL